MTNYVRCANSEKTQADSARVADHEGISASKNIRHPFTCSLWYSDSHQQKRVCTAMLSTLRWNLPL